jgi:Fe(3+) dicitrate transport protein
MRICAIILSCVLLLFAEANSQCIALQLNTGSDDFESAEAFLDNTTLSFKSDKSGKILIENISQGTHTVSVFLEGFKSVILQLESNANCDVFETIDLEPISYELDAVNVKEKSRSAAGMSYLKYIEVDGLYAAKKNEIVVLDELAMNKSTNNSRQVFAKVAGINVQETDAGGLQMGVGARGLDPKRTTNFNTRQDGYDIAADALGYPESYYTPPMEAVEQIEVVRGAASLQYGTQFGGLLNFKMKRGNPDKALELTSRQTVGSYDFYGTFNSVSGSKNGWNYYAYFQHKRGNGWRPNSNYHANGFYGSIGKQLSKKWSVDLAYTHYYYLAKQPGGLTDRQFQDNPDQSFRDRNWFRVNWNVANMTINGQLTKNLTLNSKTFMVNSSRAALGFLGNITRTDTGGARDLILGEFFNLGNETRLIQRFNLRSNPGAILLGTRLYRGFTENRQGKALGFDEPEFTFVSPEDLEGSDFKFPSQNVAAFAEMLIPLSGCWYLTPGVRYEYINTQNSGYYTEITRHPLTNELLNRTRTNEGDARTRNIFLFGIGALWRCKPGVEVYANASQNYRAMNFSDLYVSNPNLAIASDMQDETGFTLDAGFKGKALREALSFDAGVFMMQYQNRIGEMLSTITNAEGVRNIVNFRNNISDARFTGIELFEEFNLLKFLKANSKSQLTWFNNLALVRARYINSESTAIDGNRVENVPLVNYKTGVAIRVKNVGASLQANYISEQFTDATNADFFPDATVGAIPAYTVLDLSASYTWKRIKLEASVNNLTDQIYFTRRATGYPGPGIIPAQRRMVFMTLQVKI